MKSRVITDWILILCCYAVYAILIVLAVEFDLPNEAGVTAGGNGNQFLNDFRTWAFVALGISLTTVAYWYVIGEWGPKPHSTSQGSWILYWLLGFLLAAGGGGVSYFFGPQPSEGGEILAAFYIGSALLFYYLTTMLFSPVNVKYVVWGSKIFRRW
jgi:hypothetical protein